MEQKAYLILNADDYGICEQTNAAIFELFEQGLITSASLMAVGPRAPQAAQMAASVSYPVGLHLCFNSDNKHNRWKSLSAAPSLNDAQGLYYDQKKLARRAKSCDIVCEMEAQYQFLRRAGCLPDHADSHCGTLYGINGRLFFMDAFRFCQKYNLPFRLPKSPRFLDRQFGGKAPSVLLPLHRAVVKRGLAMGVRLLDDMLTNPDPIRKIQRYEVLRAYYMDALREIGPGVTELFLHPSYSPGFYGDPEDEWTKRDYELRLLRSGDLLQLAADLGIQLVSWKEAFSFPSLEGCPQGGVVK